MAKRGRRPKAAAIKRLHGNPGRRPLDVTDQAAPTIDVPGPPKVLTEAAAEYWRHYAPLLVQAGKLSPLDYGALSAYCQTLADWEREREKINETGFVVTVRDDKGALKASYISPHVQASLKLLEKLKAFGTELGLTPAARGMLQSEKAAPETNPAAAKLAEFLQRRKGNGKR
jgi:P27 family predicted phage terminase small subunit